MKNFILSAFVTLLLSSFFSHQANSQAPDPRYIDSQDLAVMISAKVNEEPASIKLTWAVSDIAQSFKVFKKLKTASYWQAPAIFECQAPLNTFTDTNVVIGEEYEYKVVATQNGSLILQKTDGSGDTTVAIPVLGYGYICAGIKASAKDLNGRLILLVDNTVAEALPVEVSRLVQDLTAEGWQVIKHNVPRTEQFNAEAVKANKQLIKDEYEKKVNWNITVLLLGRVAVPYSGRQNPDGHPDHIGAWPADLYYGSMQEDAWTDTYINDVSASRQENKNIPGDGKFDISKFNNKGFVKLAVGRIDFYNMPAFPDSEMDLIKKYLEKDHNYRIGNTDFIMRGLVDDNFGARSMPEAFASSGWRNLGAILGADSVKKIDFFTTLQTDSYMWAYGTGGGTYKSAGGIGNTQDFAEKQVNSIFTMLFGSYFGDWDSQDNFLRAPLASEPSALTCCWAGRPPWYFHHLLLGEPFSYSTVLSQNEDLTVYLPNGYVLSGTQPQVACFGYQQIHVSLMGDPTLKMYMGDKYVAPPRNLSLVQPDGQHVQLKWDAPLAEVDGYYVYRSSNYGGPYSRISDGILKETSFTEPELIDGAVYYMVRSVKLQETNGGTFYNVSRAGKDAIASIIATDVEDLAGDFQQNRWYPNPSSDMVYFSYRKEPSALNKSVSIAIFDAMGCKVKQLIKDSHIAPSFNTISWDFTDDSGNKVTPGVYFARVNNGNELTKTYKIVFVK